MACSFLNKIVLPYTYYTGSGESNNNLLGIEVSSNLITVEISYDSGSNWVAVTDGANLNFDPNNYYADLSTSIVNALNTNSSAQDFYGEVWFRDAAVPLTICKYKVFVASRTNGNGFQGATVLLQCNGDDTANLIINTSVFENNSNPAGLNTITLSGVPGFTGVTPTYISSGAFNTAVWTFSNIPINTGTSADILNLVFTSPGESNLTINYDTSGLCTPVSTTTTIAQTTTTTSTTTTTLQQSDVLLSCSELDNFFNQNSSVYNNNYSTIVYKNNNTYWKKSSGIYFEDSVLSIMSCTKTMTAVVIFKLKELGLLDLNTPISTYLPNYAGYGNKGNITLRMLLGHTSGIPADTSYEQDSNSTVQNAANLIGQNVSLLFTPGTSVNYSSAGYQVAAAVAEAVSNKSLKQLFVDYIFAPLNIVNYRWTTTPNLGSGDSTANNPIAGYGLSTSAKEYIKFVKSLAGHGVQLISQASKTLMFSDATNGIDGYFGYGILRRDVSGGSPVIDLHIKGASGCYGFINTDTNYCGVVWNSSQIQNTDPTNETFSQVVSSNLGSCGATSTSTSTTTTSSTPTITAYDFNLGTAQQGSVGNDINFPNPTVTACIFSGNFQITSALPSGASILVNNSAIPLNTSFTNADNVILQVAPNTVPGTYTFNYQVLGSCANDTAVITFTVSAAPSTTTTTVPVTTTTTPVTTSTSTTTTTSTGTIIALNINAGNILAGSSTSDIVLPVPNVTDSCIFTGSFKISSIAAYGLILKNGVPMSVGTMFNNTDLIQISTSATDIVGGYSFSYKSIGTCGESANALITYNIIAVPTTTVITTTSNLPDAKNQTVSVPIGTRGQLNISTGDRPCNTGFTSYAIKNGSITGLLNVELIDNIAYFDVIGALGYFTKQLYCSGLLVDEAVVTVEGTPNTTIPCGCTPCTNQNQQPIWQFFKQLGNTYIYKDINSCSPTYGNTESRNSCTPVPSNCGCS